MKKRKYNNGGMLQQLLPSALSLIPGGQLLSPFLQMAMENNNQPKAYTPQPAMGSNPFGKMFNGGPIIPMAPMAQESTYVQPRPFLPVLPIVPPANYQATDQYQNQQMRSANTYNPVTGLGKYDMSGGTGKVKSKDRYREKAEGGFINDHFTQYSSGSHSSGNDTQIDQYGNPVEQGVASIQNKENMYKGFIFSDTLKNPETGNKFNTDAIKINKKYKNARLDDITKSTLDFEMNKLQALNQEKINKKESKMARGGFINPPQMPYGDPQQAYNEAWQFNYGEDPNAIQPIGLDPTVMQNGQIMTDRSIVPQVPTLNLRSGVRSNGITPNSNTQSGLAMDNTQIVNAPELTLGNQYQPTTTNTATGYPAETTGSFTTERSGLGTLDAIGLGLKGAALVGSISDAVTPALKEPLITPDYSRADQYMQSANIDYSQSKQDSIGVSNIASNNIRSMSGNAGQYLSRQSGRVAQLQDSLSRISEAQNNAQSQLNLTKGQYESNKAIDTANRQYQNEQNNQMNSANTRLFDRSLSSEFSEIGSSFNQASNAQKAIQNQTDLSKFNNSQIIMFLNNKYPNVKVTPDIIEKLKAGASIDEILNVNFE